MVKTSIPRMEKTTKNKINIALATFVKTPNLSPIKTRLAKDISHKKAIKFYELSLNAIKELIKEIIDLKIDSYWAIAEKNALQLAIWSDNKTIWTGEGNLGERLNNVYCYLKKKYKFVILIGSDSPQLDKATIKKTILKLNKNNCIIGKSKDGGFYLFASGVDIKKRVFTNVTYSENTTLLQLTRNLKQHNINIKFLSEKVDVDTASDISYLLSELKNLTHISNKQKILSKWLKNLDL